MLSNEQSDIAFGCRKGGKSEQLHSRLISNLLNFRKYLIKI